MSTTHLFKHPCVNSCSLHERDPPQSCVLALLWSPWGSTCPSRGFETLWSASLHISGPSFPTAGCTHPLHRTKRLLSLSDLSLTPRLSCVFPVLWWLQYLHQYSSSRIIALPYSHYQLLGSVDSAENNPIQTVITFWLEYPIHVLHPSCKTWFKAGCVGACCNPSTRGTEAEWLRDQASLSYIVRQYQKKKEKKQGRKEGRNGFKCHCLHNVFSI
jgi:hypothetical protein